MGHPDCNCSLHIGIYNWCMGNHRCAQKIKQDYIYCSPLIFYAPYFHESILSITNGKNWDMWMFRRIDTFYSNNFIFEKSGAMGYRCYDIYYGCFAKTQNKISMKTKKLLLSLLCLISTSVPAQQLTLDNAIEIAQENSLDAQSTNSSWCIGKNRMHYFLGAHKQRDRKKR